MPTGLNATVLRPWYVLGPGHRGPCLLLPGYWVAVENPAVGMKIVEVPEIRRAGV